MTAINAGRGERNIVLLQTDVGHDKRRATDKYWGFLFFIAYFIFVALYPFVVEHDDRTGCQNHSDINTTTSQLSEFSHNKTVGKVECENVTIINATVEYALTHVWGKNWLVDAITFNVGFLDAHYEKSGSIVIWAYVLISICLVLYSFTTIRTSYLYCQQKENFIMCFIMITFLVRLMFRLIHYSYKKADATLSDICLWYWPLPELILFIVINIKSPSARFRRSCDVEDNGIPDSRNFFLIPLTFLYLLFSFFLILTPSLNKYKMDWDHHLSYVFFGGICYMCLILYYYFLMVMSCATNRSLDRERQNSHFGDFLRAWLIVAGYHFGTVCYHATLIFPRIHATFVMFEKEFRENRKLTLIDRIYLTHWKIPNLVPTMTAARGHNSTDTIRELLRLFTSDSPRLPNYQNYNQILRTFSVLLISINSLYVISLWAHGVVLDPQFLMGVSVSYFFGTFIQYLLGRYCDAIADAICLYSDRRDVTDF